LPNCWLSAGWVWTSAVAARLMLPDRTAVTNERSNAVSRSLVVHILYARFNDLTISYGVRKAIQIRVVTRYRQMLALSVMASLLG
jgi:hypothetical protein